LELGNHWWCKEERCGIPLEGAVNVYIFCRSVKREKGLKGLKGLRGLRGLRGWRGLRVDCRIRFNLLIPSIPSIPSI
jgi:hypothetical protein